MGFLARPLSPASISPQSEQQKTVTEYQEKKWWGKKERMFCHSKLHVESQIKTREETHMPVFLYLSQKKVTHQEPAAEVILVEGLKKKKRFL